MPSSLQQGSVPAAKIEFLSRRDFEGLIFGGSSSAFQYEGAADKDGRGKSIWDTFLEKNYPKLLEQKALDAINHYDRYKEDVNIMRKMGLDSYRFSISWPRVLPNGRWNKDTEEGVNGKGIDFYNNLIDELIDNKIEPMVTLFHWDFPQALEDEYGGFLSDKVVKDFKNYADLCFKKFGDRVKKWITFNETWTYSMGGYAIGSFAPGRGGNANFFMSEILPSSRITSQIKLKPNEDPPKPKKRDLSKPNEEDPSKPKEGEPKSFFLVNKRDSKSKPNEGDPKSKPKEEEPKSKPNGEDPSKPKKGDPKSKPNERDLSKPKEREPKSNTNEGDQSKPKEADPKSFFLVNKGDPKLKQNEGDQSKPKKGNPNSKPNAGDLSKPKEGDPKSKTNEGGSSKPNEEDPKSFFLVKSKPNEGDSSKPNNRDPKSKPNEGDSSKSREVDLKFKTNEGDPSKPKEGDCKSKHSKSKPKGDPSKPNEEPKSFFLVNKRDPNSMPNEGDTSKPKGDPKSSFLVNKGDPKSKLDEGDPNSKPNQEVPESKPEERHPNSKPDPYTEIYKITHNQLLAHAAAVKLYKKTYLGKEKQNGQIGIIVVSIWALPYYDGNLEDEIAANRAIDFMLGWLLKPITLGDYPNVMREEVGSRLPTFTGKQTESLIKSFDFIGLNYYTSNYVSPYKHDRSRIKYNVDSGVICHMARNGVLIGEKGGSDWLCSYPQGLKHLLLHIKEKYNNPPIYITENGIDEVNNRNASFWEAFYDYKRVFYHYTHLLALKEAISEGANVKGYFAWSLMDNLEFVDGFEKRFGLNFIHYEDEYKRIPKLSAWWFKVLLQK